MGIQWGIFGALLAAGALIAAGPRVRALHAPEPPNPAADDVDWVAPPPRRARAHAGPAPARRDRGHRDAARPPAWEGEPPDPSRAETTRLPDPSERRRRAARAADPSEAPTRRERRRRPQRLWDDDGAVNRSQVPLPMTAGDDRRRLPVPDRRARARAAPQLHAHDPRRARPAGRHARLGRPQRRRHRRRARRAHLRLRRRSGQFLRAYAESKGIALRRPQARLGRRAGGAPQGDLRRGGQAERLRRHLLRGAARRRRSCTARSTCR